MRKSMIIGAAIAALALSGCATVGTVGDTVKSSLPEICDASLIAFAGVTLAAQSGAIEPRTYERIGAVYATLEPLCVDPASVTNAEALFAAANVLAQISAVLRDAQE